MYTEIQPSEDEDNDLHVAPCNLCIGRAGLGGAVGQGHRSNEALIALAHSVIADRDLETFSSQDEGNEQEVQGSIDSASQVTKLVVLQVIEEATESSLATLVLVEEGVAGTTCSVIGDGDDVLDLMTTLLAGASSDHENMCVQTNCCVQEKGDDYSPVVARLKRVWGLEKELRTYPNFQQSM